MVHSFKVNGEYFVFDSESGSLHTADKLVFALLNDNKEILSQYSADETAEAQAEIEALKEKGLLFSAPQTSVGENYRGGYRKISFVCFKSRLQSEMPLLLCQSGRLSRQTRKYALERRA